MVEKDTAPEQDQTGQNASLPGRSTLRGKLGSGPRTDKPPKRYPAQQTNETAMRQTNKSIALLPEAQGHHPELEVGWGRLVVRLSTHSVGGLSRNDFIMAARIDRLAGPPTMADVARLQHGRKTLLPNPRNATETPRPRFHRPPDKTGPDIGPIHRRCS